MQEEYGITPNVLQHAREQGHFPKPWLKFGNRDIYLNDDIADYAKTRARAKTEKTVNELRSLLDALPESEKNEALRSLGLDGAAKSRAARS
jgi:hypothetical protein